MIYRLHLSPHIPVIIYGANGVFYKVVPTP
jgi:hypothetical protein